MATKEKEIKVVTDKLRCGIVMPISSMDGCPVEHWAEVLEIIKEAITSVEEYEFDVQLVSEQDDVGVIQKRIVQNLYGCEIIVCDVSCKNPNVMFELGMRLAFDKPTVIIKDDATGYTFDTSMIEHLEYPRDLRFKTIVSFKEKLAKKVADTYKASILSPEHSTFLKNFGSFTVAKIEQKTGTAEQVLLEAVSELTSELGRMRRRFSMSQVPPPQPPTRSGHSVRNSAMRRWTTVEQQALDELNAIVSLKVEQKNALPKDLIGDSDFYNEVLSSCVSTLPFGNDQIQDFIDSQLLALML